VIELRDVYKTYERNNEGIEALRGVSLKVEKGDIFGVIGYSGAGKSTLIRMVNGLERPTRGEVLVDGRALSGITGRELRQLRQSIGMIFQHFNLLETKTVFENVAMPLVLTGKKTPRNPRAHRGTAGVCRPVQQGAQLPEGAVRGPEAAGGHRPGAGQQSAHSAVR